MGHAGRLVDWKGRKAWSVAAMQGRVHFYEGYSAKEVTFPMRVFGRMGIRAVILTNAAGGINADTNRARWSSCAITLICKASNPLIGPNDERFGPRFPDMTKAYRADFRKIALERRQQA